jgi:hypothetical protein
MLPVIGVCTMIVAGPAFADADLAFVQEYQDAYRLMCERDNSARVCTCAMEGLEQKIGFTRFAEEVDRHRDDLFERSPVAPLAKDLVYSCRAIGRAQE